MTEFKGSFYYDLFSSSAALERFWNSEAMFVSEFGRLGRNFIEASFEPFPIPKSFSGPRRLMADRLRFTGPYTDLVEPIIGSLVVTRDLAYLRDVINPAKLARTTIDESRQVEITAVPIDTDSLPIVGDPGIMDIVENNTILKILRVQ